MIGQTSLYGQKTKASANLDQIRNGSKTSAFTPGSWVNGNAGASQAHYAEGWSIPYRIILENLSLGQHVLIIEWDITHSGKHALDYITHYNNLDNQPGSHFGTFQHDPEEIDPTDGVSFPLDPANEFPIPAPHATQTGAKTGLPKSSFDDLPNGLKMMTIYNGTINAGGLVYDYSQANYDSQSSIRLTITFTAEKSNVIIAWAGHIAAEYDWGPGEGATAVSGSPYHTRLISLDGSGGNQDRSLAAAAVTPPPPACGISPNSETICKGYTAEFSGPQGMDSYSWSISPSSGASLSSTTTETVVVTGNAAGNYTLTLETVKNGVSSTAICTATLTVNETAAPAVDLTQPDCGTATGTIEVTAPLDDGIIDYSYSIDGVNYQDPTTFSEVPSDTYTVTAMANGCISVGTPAVIDNQPSTPDAPTIIINDVSLCGDSLKGSITVCNPIEGYTYRLYLGEYKEPTSTIEVTVANQEVKFTDLDAGSQPSVDVITPDGCISGRTGCSGGDKVVTECPSLNPIAAATKVAAPIEAKTESAGFDAYPVPFKDQLTIKYKFDYVSDAKIEVFNAQGILVLSKTDSNSYLNKEIALDLKMNKGKEQVYVVKLTTDRGSSTKKVMSSR